MNPLVLVVDDEPDAEVLFRQQFRRDLRTGRFTMEFAQSAPVALQRISDAAGISLILIRRLIVDQLNQRLPALSRPLRNSLRSRRAELTSAARSCCNAGNWHKVDLASQGNSYKAGEEP